MLNKIHLPMSPLLDIIPFSCIHVYVRASTAVTKHHLGSKGFILNLQFYITIPH